MKTGIFVRGQQAAFSSITDSLDIWQPFFEEQQTGFLSSAPIGSYFFYLQFFPKEESLIPINLKNLTPIKGNTFERQHLISDGQLFRLTAEDSRRKLADLYLYHFIFIDLPTQAFFDPNKTVLKVLQTHCSSAFNSSHFADYATYFFTDCRFNN